LRAAAAGPIGRDSVQLMANDWNQTIIDEFRANKGKVGGRFEGAPMILVHHLGRKSGTERVNPLVYQPLDKGYAIFASAAGAPESPDWYRNLIAEPTATVEVGAETLQVRVREAEGDERTTIWERQKQLAPGFAEYEVSAAPRQIPVVILEPAE
jgi:deazaflavin-dependent oxidoreductase (nitroreductase family)